MTAAMAATAFAATTPQQVADAQETSFTDVDTSNDHFENIERAVERGYVQGFPDGTYKPQHDITRGQIATMLTRALQLDVEENIEEDVFGDVSANNYFAPVVKAISDAGIMNGVSSEEFAPARDLSREQMATIIVRAFDLERDESIDVVVNDLDSAHSSHQANVEILSQYGITFTPDNNFNPKDPVTRGQMASFLERTFDVVHTEKAGLEDIQAINNNSVRITFADDVNVEELTAEQFSFNNDLEVLDVEVTDENAVTLTTTEQDSETTYTLSFDGERTTLSFAGSDEVVEEVELAIESLVVDNDGFTTSVSAEVLGSDDETEAHVAIVDADGEVVTEEVVSVEEGAIEADFAGLLAGEYKAVVTIDNEEEDIVAEADFDISNLVLPLEVAEATTTQVRPAEGQELAFTVDDLSYDIADLVEAGYEVKFLLNKEELEVSKEGIINIPEDLESFSYAVRVTDAENDERTVTSIRQEVEVVSAEAIAEITEVALVSGEDVVEGNVVTSNTDAKFEVISAVNGYGEEIDFDEVDQPAIEKAVSSDVTVAHYNNEDGIVVQGEGEVAFEVTLKASKML